VGRVAATGAAVPVIYGLAIGDPLTSGILVGLALALAGVAAVAWEPDEGAREKSTSGLWLGLVAAAGFGVAFVLLDAASASATGWAVLGNRLGAVSAVAAAIALARPGIAFRRTDLPLLVAIGVLDSVAVAMFSTASTLGHIGLVATLSSLYPLVTALLARTVLGEQLGVVRRVGAMGATAGAVMLAVAAA
jgi:drug/metabolite transporter (DMT)-like permease